MKSLFTLLALAFCLQAHAQDLLITNDGKAYAVKILDFENGHFFFRLDGDTTSKPKKAMYSYIAEYHTKNRELVNKVEAYDRKAYDKLLTYEQAAGHFDKLEHTTGTPSLGTIEKPDTTRQKLIHQQASPETGKPILIPSQLTAAYHFEKAGNNIIGGAVLLGLGIIIPSVAYGVTDFSKENSADQMKASYWIGAISGAIGLGCLANGGSHLIKAGKRLQANKELTLKMGIGSGSICYRF